MARHTKEWNEGYQAAIEAIKKSLQGGNSGKNDGGQEDDNGLSNDMIPPPSNGGSGSSGGNSNNQESSDSRTNPNDSSQGIVRPEDCAGQNNSALSNTPSTPGGFFDKENGDKLAESEGYKKEGGSQDAVERDWKEAAKRAANDIKVGNNPSDVWGSLKSTIEGLYKTSKDWKKDLRFVVGNSINKAEQRRALVNKNALVAHGSMLRTDKDKYDNMDYLMVVIDSSASVSDEDLRVVLTEVYAIAIAKKPSIKLVVVQCDTAVQEVKEYVNLAQLKKDIKVAEVKGRGGTNMRAIWKFLETDKRYNRIKPDLLMIFSDMDARYCQNPRDQKHMNWLCWCILDDPGFQLKYPDSKTKVIHINSSDIKK